MNFLVDIGNSRIKWAHQTGVQLFDHGSKFYDKENVAKCFDASWHDIAVPERFLVANVGGERVAEQLLQWSVRNWNVTPEFASVTKSAFGVINAYKDVTRLGIDRWLALIAVWQKYQSAACIVDCGTAVTIDGLNADGEHMGGLILPGIMLMQQSLHHKTMIVAGKQNENIKSMAKTTEQAIESGCTLAVVGLIEHVLKDLEKTSGKKLSCILTGGDADRIKNLLPKAFISEPHIVLEGLSVLAGKNL